MSVWRKLSPSVRAILTMIATIAGWIAAAYMVIGTCAILEVTSGYSTHDLGSIWYPALYAWYISGGLCAVGAVFGTIGLAVVSLQTWYEDLCTKYSKTQRKEEQ